MLCDPVKSQRRGSGGSRLRVDADLFQRADVTGDERAVADHSHASPRRRRVPSPNRARLESRRRSARPTANRRRPPPRDRPRAPACARRIWHARARRRPILARRRGRTPRPGASAAPGDSAAILPRMLCASSTAYNSPVMYVANSTRRPRSTIAHLLCVPGSTARTRGSSSPTAPTSCVSSPRMTSGTPAAPMQRAPGTIGELATGRLASVPVRTRRDPPGIRRMALRSSPAGCRSSRRRSAVPHRRANRRAVYRARRRSCRRAAFRCQAGALRVARYFARRTEAIRARRRGTPVDGDQGRAAGFGHGPRR